ncbi:YybS family protein [Oceanobacillus massiliensis]|uniref:YybS family protein n=1 Tax=Oceanobacillus massiliensis TaxID=1465765 RepID=UPI000288E18F|nr:YybS family protein [Oceanobacillus massiliensis]
MNQSRKMTDGALLLAIFMVLVFITVFVPVLSIFGMFVLPVPFVLYASRYGFKPSLLMLAVALVLTVILTTFFTLPLAVLMGIGGIAIGGAIRKGLSPYETWARGTLGFIAGLLFVFVFSQIVLSMNWVEEFKVMLSDSLEMSMSVMEQFGAAEQTEEMEEMLQLQVETIIDLLPVGFALSAIILAFLSQWISYKFINRLEKKQLYFPAFRNLRFPTSIIWVYFFALFFSFLGPDSGFYYMALQNVLVLTGLLMTLQGFSFIFFYAHHKRMSRAIPIFSVVLTILFPTFLLYFVRILGIIDIGFRLRDYLTKKK